MSPPVACTWPLHHHTQLQCPGCDGTCQSPAESGLSPLPKIHEGWAPCARLGDELTGRMLRGESASGVSAVNRPSCCRPANTSPPLPPPSAAQPCLMSVTVAWHWVAGGDPRCCCCRCQVASCCAAISTGTSAAVPPYSSGTTAGPRLCKQRGQGGLWNALSGQAKPPWVNAHGGALASQAAQARRLQRC